MPSETYGMTCRFVAIPICLLLAALPAGAEFYRWKDASGREHFAQEIHQVPPEYRAEAARRQKKREGGATINYHAAPKRKTTAGGRAEAKKVAPAAQAPASWDCGALKRESKKKQKVIRRHRGSVASNLRWADDITKSAFSRRKYEARAEEEGRWLAKAELDLARFLEQNRKRGVPHGCLRE